MKRRSFIKNVVFTGSRFLVLSSCLNIDFLFSKGKETIKDRTKIKNQGVHLAHSLDERFYRTTNVIN